MFGQIDLLSTIQYIVAILIGLSVHEASHATSAYLLGDKTPKLQGRVTLNPIAHLDPVGTVMMVLSAIAGFGFGWGKPVQINPMNMRKVSPQLGWAISSAAGPASNLLVAAVLMLPIRFELIPNYNLLEFLVIIAIVNVFLALFNLIPIPPLDGFHVVQGLVPRQQAAAMAELERFGPMVLLIVVFFGMRFLGPVLNAGAMSILSFLAG